MPDAPAISVIVPCYNYGHFLPDAIRSIQAQRFSDWECIIVDDGSQDNTQNVAAQLASKDVRITYVHQSNAGLSAARNKGLSLARGKYIQLLDADDGIAPDKFLLQYQFLETNSKID